VSEYGDEATLVLKNENELECEIIYFTDTAIVFTPGKTRDIVHRFQLKKLYYLKYENIISVSIAGFDGKGWGGNVLAFQIVPAGLLALAASMAGSDALSVFAISSIPAIITSFFLLGIEGETPEWNLINKSGDLEEMNKYARYPNGLNEGELLYLLDQSKQSVIKEYKVE
jgi:hypothetical protein